VTQLRLPDYEMKLVKTISVSENIFSVKINSVEFKIRSDLHDVGIREVLEYLFEMSKNGNETFMGFCKNRRLALDNQHAHGQYTTANYYYTELKKALGRDYQTVKDSLEGIDE
jgi:hypothetical protein